MEHGPDTWREVDWRSGKGLKGTDTINTQKDRQSKDYKNKTGNTMRRRLRHTAWRGKTMVHIWQTDMTELKDGEREGQRARQTQTKGKTNMRQRYDWGKQINKHRGHAWLSQETQGQDKDKRTQQTRIPEPEIQINSETLKELNSRLELKSSSSYKGKKHESKNLKRRVKEPAPWQ